MTKTIAVVVFEGAEELDFTGPFQVLKVATENNPDWRVILVGPSRAQLTCSQSMLITPHFGYDEIEHADIVVVPGGPGSMPGADNAAAAAWLRKVAANCTWMTSVCTGAFLMVTSGICNGRKITTHAWFLDRLQELGDCDVQRGVRFVVDGNFVSAAGVMSGIEMALWLVNKTFGEDMEDHVKGYICYDDPPRGTSEGT